MRSLSEFAPLAGVAALVLAGPAAAQSDLTSPVPAQNWNLTIGGGVRYTPDYLGSNDYALRPRPIVRIGKGLGSRWWSAEDDMLGIGLVEGENWRAGVSGAFLWQRLDNANRALRGLGTVGFGIEAGGFAEYYVLPWLRARADIRRGFFAHEAIKADFKLDVFGKLSNRWTYGFGPRISFASADFNRTYFGVTPFQAATTGLPAFRPGGGLESYGGIAQLTYHWSNRVETTGYVEYKRLSGDAAKAAIVKRFGSADQWTLGLSTSWAIDLGM